MEHYASHSDALYSDEIIRGRILSRARFLGLLGETASERDVFDLVWRVKPIPS